MTILVRFFGRFRELIIKCDNTTIETGLLDEPEQQTYGLELLEAADKLFSVEQLVSMYYDKTLPSELTNAIDTIIDEFR